MKYMSVEQWHLLDGKSVLDDALPGLMEIYDLVPKGLHDDLNAILTLFKHDLALCDVSKEYEK